MMYLIDRGFRIKSALNILINQVKISGMYNECFCLSCKVLVKVNDNVNNNVNENDKVNDNVNDHDNDNENDKDKDKFIYLFGEKHQRDKTNSKEITCNIISITANGSLQS